VSGIIAPPAEVMQIKTGNTHSLGRDLGPFVFVAEGYDFHLLSLS
jgi:hypothetical protein